MERKLKKMLSGIAAAALVGSAMPAVYADNDNGYNYWGPNGSQGYYPNNGQSSDTESPPEEDAESPPEENTDDLTGETAETPPDESTPPPTDGEEPENSETQSPAEAPPDIFDTIPTLPADTEITSVPIDAEHFPDDVFRDYIKGEFDMNGDNYLSAEELQNAVSISIIYSDVSSLAGVEYLRYLEVLSCYGNNISSVDVSKNTELTALDCCDNKLTVLDVTNNKKLTYLCFGWGEGMGNGITYIDISSNPELEELHGSNTLLPYINVTGTKVDYLDVSLCKYVLPEGTTEFDFTSIPGFDITKVSDVSGALYDSGTGRLTHITDRVTYKYDCGNGFSETFTLYVGSVDNVPDVLPDSPQVTPVPTEPSRSDPPPAANDPPPSNTAKPAAPVKERKKSYTVTNDTTSDVMKIDVDMDRYENPIDIKIEKTETPSEKFKNEIAKYAARQGTKKYAYLPMEISVTDVKTKKKLTSLENGAEITFSMSIPEPLYRYRSKMKVLHMNGDTLEVIEPEFVMNKKTGQKGVRFTLSAFSPVSLYVDADGMSDEEFEDIRSYAWVTSKGEEVYDISAGSGLTELLSPWSAEDSGKRQIKVFAAEIAGLLALSAVIIKGIRIK